MGIGLSDEGSRVWSAISADIDLEPSRNDSIANVWKYVTPDDPRSTAREIAAGVREFCGDVDEFWAWIPCFGSVAAWFRLGSDAAEVFATYWDWDLQMLRSLVVPWPDGWPVRLHDLNATALEAGIDARSRQANHPAPDVHVEWRCELFEPIAGARQG